MIRYLTVLPLAAVLATQALAATKTTITNNSGLPIDELFSAAPGTKAWGTNILDGVPEGALDSGKTIEVANLADGTYDLRILAPDEGVLCYMENVTVKDHKVDLTPDMGKACK
jgi:hypothetical protein